MEVCITFDTEKESVEDLKRLILSLQDLVAQKEKAVTLGNPLAAASIRNPAQGKREARSEQHVQLPLDGRTGGGGRVVEYQDLTPIMAKVFSGKG